MILFNKNFNKIFIYKSNFKNKIKCSFYNKNNYIEKDCFKKYFKLRNFNRSNKSNKFNKIDKSSLVNKIKKFININ
jgi:hypothetical protein